MKCPSFKTSTFSPTKLEPSLGATECQECYGILLDLVAYRLWRERHLHDTQTETEMAPEPETDTSALLCARCDRIMLRFRYTKDTSHVLDVCGHCDNVWLQKDEWAFLKQHKLQDKVSQIFTSPWQHSLRSERTRAGLNKQWDERLGEELHNEVSELREWINHHPHRESILNYLLNDAPYST